MPKRSLTGCHVCRGRRTKVVASIVSEVDGQGYDAVQCDDCGLLFADPAPEFSLEDLQGVYDSEYTGALREPVEDPRVLRILSDATSRQMELVEQHVSVGRALNIGAMSRATAVLIERGWSLSAVEVSRYAAESARAQWGLDVTVSRIEDYSCSPGSFDFVKMGHVIEHLVSPRRALQSVANALRPGGVLLVDTDNARGLRSEIEGSVRRLLGERLSVALVKKLTRKNLRKKYGRLIPPVHLYIFSEASLIRLLNETGFEVICTRRPAWGDPTWFPLTQLNGLSLVERAFLKLDQVGAKFGRGELLSVMARRSGSMSQVAR